MRLNVNVLLCREGHDSPRVPGPFERHGSTPVRAMISETTSCSRSPAISCMASNRSGAARRQPPVFTSAT